MKVKITNIGENQRHPGIIYAQLRDVEGDTLRIGATLDYIFDMLRERPEYDCVNVTQDKWGNYHIVG